MMKKSILLIASTLLASSAAWADTVTNDGVQYTILSSDVDEGSVIEGTANKTATFDTTGVVTYTSSQINTQSIKDALTVEATKATTTSGIVTINTFSTENTDTVSNSNVSGTYAAGSDEYKTYMAEAKSLISFGSSKIMSYDEYCASTGYYSKSYRDKNGKITDTDKRKIYYYVVTSNYVEIGDVDLLCATGRAIESISVSKSVETEKSYSYTYTPTQIGSSFLSDAVSVIMVQIKNAELATIEAGAFNNSNFKTLHVENNNNFVVGSSYVMDAAQKNVIASYATAEGSYTLPKTVENIYDYAYTSVQNELTVISTNRNIKYNDQNNSKVTFSFPSAISITEASDGGHVITGTILNDTEFNDILDKYASERYIDFSGAQFSTSVSVNNTSNGTNQIIYLPSGVTVTGNYKNVVIGTSCENLELIDKQEFYNKKGFNATSARLTRTMNTDTWGTIVLPFAVDADNAWAGSLYARDVTSTKMTFQKVTTIKANEPHVFYNNSGSAINEFTAANVSVPATTNATKTVSNMDFVGVYTTKKLGSDYYYGYTTAGNFIKCAGNTITAFRAYFYDQSGLDITPASASEMRFIDEFGEEVNLGESTGISEIENIKTENVTFNVNGQKVNDTKNAGLYIVNGKKVIIK